MIFRVIRNTRLPEKSFYKTALLLMLPMIFQNLISHTLGFADTLMVGMLGESELAAMTVANTPFFILLIATFGIQSGAGVLVAQYHGRGDKDAINRILGVGLYVGVIFTAVVSGVIALFPELTMRLLTSNMELVPLGARYARIIGLSYVFASVSGIYLAVQRSMEKAALGAWILGGSALLNIFLNWILIFGKFGAPALGIEGAAIATVISRIGEVIAVIVYSFFDKDFRIVPKNLLFPGKAMLQDFAKYALPVVINETLWSFGTSMYTVIMGYMEGSTAILAASTLTANVERIISVVLFAAGNAAAVLVGKAIGEHGREEAFSRALGLELMGLGIGLINLVMLLVIRFFFAESLIYPLMHLSPDGCRITNFMLVALACMSVFRSVNHVNIVGLLRGGGDVKTAMYLDVLPIYLFALPMSALAALVFKWGIVWMFLFKISDEIPKVFIGMRRIASGDWIRDVTRSA